MNFKSMYAEKRLSIPDAVGLLRSGQRVVAAMCASEPVGLLSELEHHAGPLRRFDEGRGLLPFRLPFGGVFPLGKGRVAGNGKSGSVESPAFFPFGRHSRNRSGR